MDSGKKTLLIGLIITTLALAAGAFIVSSRLPGDNNGNNTTTPTPTTQAGVTVTVSAAPTTTVQPTSTNVTGTPGISPTSIILPTIDPTKGASCPEDLKPVFWYGCVGSPVPGCNGLTDWVDGAAVTNAYPFSPAIIDVSCQDLEGNEYSGARLTLSQNGSVLNFPSFSIDDFGIIDDIVYTFTCTDSLDLSCTGSDTFTTGDVPAITLTPIVTATSGVSPSIVIPTFTPTGTTGSPLIPTATTIVIVTPTTDLPATAIAEDNLLKIIAGVIMFLTGVMLFLMKADYYLINNTKALIYKISVERKLDKEKSKKQKFEDNVKSKL